MKIKLDSLRLKNFKGAQPLDIKFSDKTNIYGDNRVGKTRLIDSFLWLLFGKDSQDKSDFSIKPLDSENNPIPKVEVVVEAQLDIDGQKLSLMKLYKEKWQKKKGQLEPELTGHEIIYYVDSINVQKSKYDSVINEFIYQDIFRYITNPVYFESQNWTIKRKMLFEMSKIATDSEIAIGNKDFEDLLIKLKGRDASDYKKDIQKTIRAIQTDLDLMPPRIDENRMQIPSIRRNISELKFLIDGKSKFINDLENQRKNLSDAHKSQNEVANKISADILDIDSKSYQIKLDIQKEQNELKFKQESEINILKSTIESLTNSCRQISRTIEANNEEIVLFDEQLDLLRKDWYSIMDSELQISSKNTHCPTCNREFENSEDIIKQLKVNFNKSKVENIQNLEKKAKVKKDSRLKLLKDNDILDKELQAKKEKVKELELKLIEQIKNPTSQEVVFILAENKEYKLLLQQKEAKQNELLKVSTSLDTSAIDEKIDIARKELQELNNQLTEEQNIDKIEVRIQELEQEMRDKAQNISEFEQLLSVIDDFTKTKVELLESAINAKFKFVKFKLYNRLLNGELEECCTTLVDGVPYHSTNYASRINAGLDIINVLSEHYNVYAPVFIDNSESISYPLEMNTQVIRLIKEIGQNKLRIEND